MQFAAIVERRLMHWYVYIPSLATGGPVPDADDVEAYAVAWAAAASGLPQEELQVRLHPVGPGDTVLSISPTDVEARHTDGIWRTAQLTGSLRQWNGSWWPLVSYAVDGVSWTRAVRASCVRQQGAEVSAVPIPRANVGSPSLVR